MESKTPPGMALARRMARSPSRVHRTGQWPHDEWALLCVDLLMLSIGGGVALASGWGVPGVALTFGGIAFAALAAGGSYRSRLRPVALDRVATALAALSIAATAAYTVGAIVVGPGDVPLAAIGASFVASAIAVTTGRTLWTVLQHAGRVRGQGLEPVLIVGTGRVGARLAGHLHKHPEYGLVPAGFLDSDPYPLAATEENGVPPFLGGPTALAGAVAATNARHVMLAFSPLSDDGLITMIRRCQDLGVSVSVVPRFFEVMNERAIVEHVGGLPLLRLEGHKSRGWRFAIKGMIDRIVSICALVLGAPLFAALALAIKVESPGPVFFRQRRVGRDGQVFQLVKFRSMRPGESCDAFDLAPGAAPGGIEGEDRRTRVGRVLRRTCLDELPQLINVARGEMSLVGPRPERPEFAEVFGEQLHSYEERHRVSSGITGLAQVKGLRGQTSIVERVEWDNYYIENWSLWLDVKILILTLVAIVRTPRDA
jgi:exopolysaccharide biosynthesis polyprenyl glycosylphosphotransferase